MQQWWNERSVEQWWNERQKEISEEQWTILYGGEKNITYYWDANKSFARPGRKQATATEDFDVHISYL